VTNVSIQAPDYRNPTADFGDHELSSLALYNTMTLASFELRKEENLPADELKSLEAAYNAAQDYARNPSGWIVFTGPYGCGKTHLAAAIGHYCLDNGYDLIFVSAPELLDHLRATFSPNSVISLDRLFEEVKTTRLLILDDLDTGSSTAWAKEKLYQLFNYRHLFPPANRDHHFQRI
jgi:DNA replication protein DnaC